MTEAEYQVDLELWGRFIDRIIEQTTAGDLRWEMRFTGEYCRYAVCAVRDRTLWYRGSGKPCVELVEPDGRRWTVNIVDSRMKRLVEAIGNQLTPSHMVVAHQFARDFLGELK